MSKLDLSQLSEFVDQWWDDSALPSHCEFVEIPALSPSFDSDWEANGYLDAAVNTFVAWVRSLPLKGLTVSVHRLKNRSPVLLVRIEGDADGDVLFYSHLDKNPRPRAGQREKVPGRLSSKTSGSLEGEAWTMDMVAMLAFCRYWHFRIRGSLIRPAGS